MIHVYCSTFVKKLRKTLENKNIKTCFIEKVYKT